MLRMCCLPTYMTQSMFQLFYFQAKDISEKLNVQCVNCKAMMISLVSKLIFCHVNKRLFFHHLYTISWLSVMKLFEVKVLLPIMASSEDI